MASAIFISTILPPMAAKAMDIIKDKGLAIGKYIADKAVDKAVDKPMDKAMAMVVDKVDGIVNIESDISKLQTTLRMIKSIVRVAEEKQINDDFIRNWLRDLIDIGYEARDVLDDFITFSSCIIRAGEASNPVNFISSFMLSYFGGSSSDTSNIPLTVLNRLEKDIRSVRVRFDKKKKEGDTFGTLKDSESVRVDRRPIVGPSINKQRDGLFLGRKKVKEGIMQKILHPSDDHVHVVLIWGMGGIGKTTLAQSIYNDERVKKVPRKWLCVGESKFSAEKVIREIVNDQNTTGIGNLDAKLQKELSGDRFLIVLDDVWDVDGSEWNLLFNPLTEVGKGGLIIITKRERELCAAITIQMAYNLEPLSEEDSWSIFESCAYVNGKSDSTPERKGIGDQIVKKLNGHPLALKVVGRSLLNKDSSTWTDFLESKFSEDDEVMSALRWSYNHLPPHLKMCFTYCSLFPKDHVFDNEKVLVQMWMAHDLIKKEEQKRPEDVGAQYFEELVNASLFQCVDGKHVMHDLIHDLALLVSNREFTTANGSLTNDQMKKVRHITVTPGDYSKISRLCKIEKLLTLYTTRNQIYTTEKFDYSVLDDVFKQLKIIRVLVLDSSKIADIPDCISELRHLRYLDVRRTSVKSLPDTLCRLYNLQMLAAPPYTVLPRDIVNMVNLRYVRAKLATCKGVGKLTSLQELSSIHICEGDNIRELGDMQILRGKLTIKGLGNVEKLEDDIAALMEKQTLMDELELEFDKRLKKSTISAQVLDALGCPPNLTYLRIAGYNGLKPPNWMVDGKHKFDKLQTLELYDCPKLEFLPPLGGFDKLQTLQLSNCPKLECLRPLGGFDKLQTLQLSNCPKLESLPPLRGFDKLQTLELYNCSKLKSLPPLGELTSLKHLSLYKVGVKRLRDEFYGKFTYGMVFFPSLESLRFIGMEEWEEWDDIIIENSSVSFFPRLTSLSLLECPKLESLPPLGELTSLKHLYLRKVGVKRLEDEFYGKFTDVKVFFPSLQSLCFDNMQEWEEWDDIIIENSSVSFFPRLTRLEVRYCSKLVSVLPVVKNPIMNAANFMTSLSRLKIWKCDGLKRLQLDALVSLKELSIIDCPQLQSLPPDFHKLSSLKELWINRCPQLQSLPPDFHKLCSLERLHILSCPQLQSLPPDFHKLSSLKSLSIKDCPQLQSLPRDFHKLSSLKDLSIYCPQLQSLPPDFHKLSSLESLSIYPCPQLQSLPPDFHKLPSLEKLYIFSCPQLQSLPAYFRKKTIFGDHKVHSYDGGGDVDGGGGEYDSAYVL